jgi:hypothetical protein
MPDLIDYLRKCENQDVGMNVRGVFLTIALPSLFFGLIRFHQDNNCLAVSKKRLQTFGSRLFFWPHRMVRHIDLWNFHLDTGNLEAHDPGISTKIYKEGSS